MDLADDVVHRAPPHGTVRLVAEEPDVALVEQRPVIDLVGDARGDAGRVLGLLEREVAEHRRLPREGRVVEPDRARRVREPVLRQDHRLGRWRAVRAVQDQGVVPRTPVPGGPTLVQGSVDPADREPHGPGVGRADHDLVPRGDVEGIRDQVGDQHTVVGGPLEDVDVVEHVLAGEQPRVPPLLLAGNRDRCGRAERRLERGAEVGARVDEPPQDRVDLRLDVPVPDRAGERQRTVPVHHPDPPARVRGIVDPGRHELARGRRDEQRVGRSGEREQERAHRDRDEQPWIPQQDQRGLRPQRIGAPGCAAIPSPCSRHRPPVRVRQ